MIKGESDREVILTLLTLPNVLDRSYNTKSISEIAEYIYKLTSLFNTFNLLLGYPKESKDTNRVFNRVLMVLADKELINVSGEVITAL